ncbi:MAG: S1 RNA-binding domain-containing protein [Anaerolineales bacterium]|nr:S1 RNA-binding domain-containing protein [Anaerolineales bacterium]
MKNLYSLTPKQLTSITRNSHPPVQPSAPPPTSSAPARPARPAESRAAYEPASPNTPSESWWSSVLGEEGGGGRPPAGESGASDRRPAASDWAAARELYESDGIADLHVTGVNRGGLLVEGGDIRGFVPLSHLIGVPSLNSDEERQTVMYRKIGQTIRGKIIEFDPEKGRVVFSERAAQAAPGRRAELLSKLQVGERIQGEVTNITNFGVFIDLGGMEGLVHLSEISWGRVHNPADFVSIGQKVDVEVISIDRDQGRVALSLKRLQADPWVTVPERYVPGAWVPCKITHVTNFGAFAALEEGVEGLIHISELADGPFSHPRNIVAEGEEVTARVLSVESQTRRLALSLRKPREDSGSEAAAPAEPDDSAAPAEATDSAAATDIEG